MLPQLARILASHGLRGDPSLIRKMREVLPIPSAPDTQSTDVSELSINELQELLRSAPVINLNEEAEVSAWWPSDGVAARMPARLLVDHLMTGGTQPRMMSSFQTDPGTYYWIMNRS